MNNSERNALDCAIVGDLLSLYHDDVVSETTKTAVEEHLAGCEGCRREYDALRRELPIDAGEKSTGKRFASLMRWQKIKKVLCVVLPVLLAFVILTAGLSLPVAGFNESVNAPQVFRFDSDGVSKFFLLIDHPMYAGAVNAELIPIRSEQGVCLVLNFDKPALVTRLDGRCTYAEIYEAPAYVPDTFTCDEVYEVRIGDRVVWSEAENADDAIPAYVYEYEHFDGSTITQWDIDYDPSDPDLCAMAAIYSDGHTVKWDFEGNVLEENFEWTYDSEPDILG